MIKDARAKLHLLTEFIGPAYGTEAFALFLYSLVRMQVPKTIVELGTGVGTSALWMALAAHENGTGTVWTVDDLSVFQKHQSLVADTVSYMTQSDIGSIIAETGEEYLRAVARLFEIDDVLEFVFARMELDEPGHFQKYPFYKDPVDLLFSDFRHGARDTISLLGAFLPRMAPNSSIFIDSASTAWPSFLVLEQLVAQLNSGRIPLALQQCSDADLSTIMRNRRIVLMHLTEVKERHQNSTAWLKLEPVDVLPQPPTLMRGYQ